MNTELFTDIYNDSLKMVDAGLDHTEYKYPTFALLEDSIKIEGFKELIDDGLITDEQFIEFSKKYADRILKDLYESCKDYLEDVFDEEWQQAFDKWKIETGMNYQHYDNNGKVLSYDAFQEERKRIHDMFDKKFKSELELNDDLVDIVLSKFADRGFDGKTFITHVKTIVQDLIKEKKTGNE